MLKFANLSLIRCGVQITLFNASEMRGIHSYISFMNMNMDMNMWRCRK